MPVLLEFHPAALEIRETPLPRSLRALSWALILTCVAAAAWAWLGHVDVVAIARGKVVPAGRVKVIQSLEGGVVRAIHAREGDRVDAGAVLLELDGTAPDAEVAQIHGQVVGLALEQARLQALLAAEDAGGVKVPDVPGATGTQQESLRDRVQQEHGARQARRRSLDEEQRQRIAERAAARSRLAQIEATLPLVTERATAARALVTQGLLPRFQWLELEEARRVQVSQYDVERETVAMLDAAVAGLAPRRLELEAEFRQRLLAELADVQLRLAALRQESVKATQRRAQQVLTAPVAGIVQRVAVRTMGGVVTAAQPLMEIVPEDGALEIEAWVNNQDAGLVRAGQPAIIKFDAFPFTRHGTLAGTLLGLSPDAVADEQRGLIYAARLGLARAAYRVDGREVRLSPGMAATVEFQLGRRRVADFLLAPLLRYRDEALRER